VEEHELQELNGLPSGVTDEQQEVQVEAGVSHVC